MVSLSFSLWRDTKAKPNKIEAGSRNFEFGFKSFFYLVKMRTGTILLALSMILGTSGQAVNVGVAAQDDTAAETLGVASKEPFIASTTQKEKHYSPKMVDQGYLSDIMRRRRLAKEKKEVMAGLESFEENFVKKVATCEMCDSALQMASQIDEQDVSLFVHLDVYYLAQVCAR